MANAAPERIELLPCPFCGERKFSLALTKRNYCQLHGEPSQGFRIACRNDRCVSRPSVVAGDAEQSGGQNKARYDASLAWNNRAAMQPAPSQSDEAVAREIAIERNLPWTDEDEKRVAAILARHRQSAEAALAAEVERLRVELLAALRVIKDCTDYEHNGDPWTENAFDMGELDIHDYVRDGRYEHAFALAQKQEG